MPTPAAPSPQLGWVGTDPDAPDVRALRSHLQAHNGLPGLEILAPHEIHRATQIFYRDGFVVVHDALSVQQLQFLREGVRREVAAMLEHDPGRGGNRGSHRYSFGGASLSGHLLHLPEWAMLIDLPMVTPIISAIFESTDYHARGGGGDFCLPGAIDYQPLHSDMSDRQVFQRKDGTPKVFGSFHDPSGRLNYRDLPCPNVTCNFLTVDSTAMNGPTRQIAGTQQSQQPIPGLDEEPEWMKLSTICPAPAGSVLIRDIRAWHGGTPNVSDELRAIPNVEYYAPWFIEPQPKSIPREIFNTLSEHGKHVCRFVVPDQGDVLTTGYRTKFGSTPFTPT